jgi:hypothetical protein
MMMTWFLLLLLMWLLMLMLMLVQVQVQVQVQVRVRVQVEVAYEWLSPLSSHPYLSLRLFICTHVRAQSMLHAVLVCISAGIWQALWQVYDTGGLWGEVGPGGIVRIYDKSLMFFWNSDQIIPLGNINSIPAVIPGIQVAIFNSYAE